MALFGVVGFPLRHSLSYRINSAVLRDFGDLYVPFEVPPERFHRAVDGLLALVDGFNVTIPYKVVVMLHLSRISEDARSIGAVNVVRTEGGKGVGYNTDYLAIVNLMKGLRCDRALIFGAGGAARASAYAMVKLGCSEILIYNRTQSRAISLSNQIERWGARSRVVTAPEDADVFINATPLGMYEDDAELIRFYRGARFRTVLDLAYRLEGTSLSRIAGSSYISGIDVLIEQAALSIEIWKGFKVERERMRSALYEGQS
ncbi:MAG: shikimate dehydrogenase family protein [Nitrososphaeria archaeon]